MEIRNYKKFTNTENFLKTNLNLILDLKYLKVNLKENIFL